MKSTRLKPIEVLDNYTRAQIYNYIFRNSGVGYNEVKKALGVANATVRHHLDILIQTGYMVLFRGEMVLCIMYPVEKMIF